LFGVFAKQEDKKLLVTRPKTEELNDMDRTYTLRRELILKKKYIPGPAYRGIYFQPVEQNETL
jgi:hypothetical protein